MSSTQVKILVPGNHLMVGLLGQRDELLRLVETAFGGARIFVRGNEITIDGEDAERVGKLFEEMVLLLEAGHALDPTNVGRTIDMVKADERPSEVLTAEVLRSSRGRSVRAKSAGQKRYVDAIAKNVITFGIGPAGTGKSYLAVALAVQALQAKEVARIILTRPAVEAGERLGFLPGDLMAKIDPYLRPLYDALHDMLEADGMQRLMERGTIEVAPLAFMRGRAQPVDQRVLTPGGWQTIGSLRIGDLVVGSDGQPTPVIGVYPQGEREVFRVTAQDGASTLCCAEHLWFVTTPDDRNHGKPGRVLRTRAMIGRLRRHRQHRFELPVLSAPVQFPPRPVAMDPYALGLLIGELSRNKATESVALFLETQRVAAVGRRGGVAVDSILAPTTSQPRSVPPEYLWNSPDVRIAVLRGLLDSGADFGPSEPQLRQDVLFLVRSLGGVGLSGRRFIDSIEPAGRAETVCIQVGAADSLYVTDDFLLTHNTINNAFIILDEAQNTTPEQMKMFLTRIGFGTKAVITGDVTQIDLAGARSGLLGLDKILSGIDGLEFVSLGARDVVRHRIVQDIVTAYERLD